MMMSMNMTLSMNMTWMSKNRGVHKIDSWTVKGRR